MPVVYDVVPLEGVGPVRLGMTQAESRAAMAQEPRELRRASGDHRDLYHSGAFQVFFDRAGTVEFIELSRLPEIEARFHGTAVLSLPVQLAIEYVSTITDLTSEGPERGYTYWSPSLELALWRGVIDDEVPEGALFSTIAIGRHGYFSDRSNSNETA